MSDWLTHAHAAATADQAVAAAAAAAVAEVNQAAEALTVMPHLVDAHNGMQPPEAGAVIETGTIEHAMEEGAIEQVITTTTTNDDSAANEALQQALSCAVAMVVCVSQEGASSVVCASDGSDAKPQTVGDAQFLCETCGQRFLRKSHLSRHRLIHSGERPFQCDICEKSFRQSSHLSSHKNTHTGARPYQCGQCDKAFASSSALGRHRHTHTDPSTKPHVCDCGKAFRRLSHLVGHRYTHTGERPYQCTECGRAFADSSGLRRHKRRHAQGTVGPDGSRRNSSSSLSRPRIGGRRRRGDELEEGELMAFDENALTEMAKEEVEMEEGGTAVTLITDDLVAEEMMDDDSEEDEELAVVMKVEDPIEAAIAEHQVSLVTGVDADGNATLSAESLVVGVDSSGIGIPHSTIRITEEVLCPGADQSALSLNGGLDMSAASMDAASVLGLSGSLGEDADDVSVGLDDSALGLDTSSSSVLDVSLSSVSVDQQQQQHCGVDEAVAVDDLTCATCHEAFSKMADLAKHAKVLHLGKDDKPFRCSQCLKCFARLGHLRRHQKTHMPSLRPFACDMCTKSFRLFSHLNAHRYACHLQAGKAYRCDICGKLFMDEACLGKHNDRHIADAQEAAAAAVAAAAASADNNILTSGLTGEQAEALSAVVAASSNITMTTSSVALGHDGAQSLQQTHSPVLSSLIAGSSSEQEAVQLLSSLINTSAHLKSEEAAHAAITAAAASLPQLLPIMQTSAMAFGGTADSVLVTTGADGCLIPAAAAMPDSVTVELSSDHHHHHHHHHQQQQQQQHHVVAGHLGGVMVPAQHSVTMGLGSNQHLGGHLGEIVQAEHISTVGEDRIILVDQMDGLGHHHHHHHHHHHAQLGHLDPDGAAEEVVITVMSNDT